MIISYNKHLNLYSPIMQINIKYQIIQIRNHMQIQIDNYILMIYQ